MIQQIQNKPASPAVPPAEADDKAGKKAEKPSNADKAPRKEEAKKDFVVQSAVGLGVSLRSGEPMFIQGNVGVQKRFGDRITVVLDLDLRPLLAKSKVEHRLHESAELRGAVTAAIQQRIAAQMGVPPAAIQVPPALVDQAVEKFIGERINGQALIESSIRQIYVEAEILRSPGSPLNSIKVAVGKIDPVHRLDYDFRANPAQLLNFPFASQPTARVTAGVGARTQLYFQVSNDRLGAIEDVQGLDVVGYVQQVMTRANGALLSYKPNAWEAGAVLDGGSAGRITVSAGSRPDVRLFGDRGGENNAYVVATFRRPTPMGNIQVSGGIEEQQRGSAIKRINVILAKPLAGDRANVGVQFYARSAGADHRGFWTLALGGNYVLLQKEMLNGTLKLGPGVQVLYGRQQYAAINKPVWDARVGGGLTYVFGR